VTSSSSRNLWRPQWNRDFHASALSGLAVQCELPADFLCALTHADQTHPPASFPNVEAFSVVFDLKLNFFSIEGELDADGAGAGMFQRIVYSLLNNAEEVFRDGPSETHGSSPDRQFQLHLGTQAAAAD
jgi:hypothetical protein